MDIKPWIKVAVSIMLSFMILFTGIGYAQLSTGLSLTGQVKIQIPSGLFIIKVEEKGSPSNLDKNTYSHIQYTTSLNTILSRKSNTGKVV